MTTDPANEAREDVQRHWDQAIDVGPETIVSNPQADLCAALKASVDRARRDLAGRQKTETPAATHPAAPSAPQNASGVSEDAGTVESAREQAARVLHAWDVEGGPCVGAWEALTDAQREVWRSGGQALADAGLLADPDEVRRLRERLRYEVGAGWQRWRQMRHRAVKAEKGREQESRAKVNALAKVRHLKRLRAENARLSEALRDFAAQAKRAQETDCDVHTSCEGHEVCDLIASLQAYVRALSTGEHR